MVRVMRVRCSSTASCIYRLKYLFAEMDFSVKKIPYRLLQSPVSLKCFLIFANLTCFSSSLAAPPMLPEEMHNGIMVVTEHVYQGELIAAENEAKKIIRKYPDHPLGYFCMAFITDYLMAQYQSNDREDVFYRYCDIAIQKGEKLLVDGKEMLWAKFFIGGADGYKGTYEARYERWITAFRYGWKGVSVLLELEKTGCGIPDIYYGIGSYNYWRSALIKLLWWMPGIEDKRQIGIDQLFKARRESVYSRLWASVALIDILVNEQRFDEVLSIADDELKKFPENRFFLWGKARACAGLKQHEQASALLRQLVAATEKDEFDNHYNTTNYHLLCAKMFLLDKKYPQAIAACNRINSFSYDAAIKKRLEVQLGEVKNISKQAHIAMGKE